MKFIAWALGALFAVWIVAFFGIKIYDLGCLDSPSICVVETGIWLRKLVLLEWASKWQTLLAGIFVLSGGAATILAARIEMQFNVSKERNQKNDTIIIHATYLSELFRRASFFQRGLDDDNVISQWEDVVQSIKFLAPLNPDITGDLLYIWYLLKRYADGDDSDITMIQIRGSSACANCIMKDIINFYLSGGQEYKRRNIKATKSLINLLEQFERTLVPPFSGSKILSFIRPMDEHIDFSETSLVKR